MLKEYLKNNILVADGAMGTYYAKIGQEESTFSEWANKLKPNLIKKIHEEYIKAGAKLIRTNTFSVNSMTLNTSREEVEELLIQGYQIAKEAVGEQAVFIAADIGPIPEMIEGRFSKESKEILEEYSFIVDVFLEAGADVFLFETFSSLEYLREMAAYIKKKKPEAFVITQFAIALNGYTRKGISVNAIVEEVRQISDIDAYGFNCGIGPTHLYSILKHMDLGDDLVTALPNAGYPEIIHERTVYGENPEYFADVLVDIKNLGVKIIGGCCGTTPKHISELMKELKNPKHREYKKISVKKAMIPTLDSKHNYFQDKLNKNEFIMAVELDPPFGVDTHKIMKAASLLKESGVDIITIADSPLGRPRVDSIMMAAKIQREVDIATMPHICCRDKNIIGLRAKLLGAYMEGIRNLLLVTGDPIPSADRNEIKSVFNVNSYRLMELVEEMNKDKFIENPYHYGGALNLNVRKKQVEIERMKKKIEAGAEFFLTQPIFESEAIKTLKEIKKNYQTKIIAGILPLVSFRNAQFLNNEIPGIKIPDPVIGLFRKDMSREEAEEIGIKVALEMTEKLKDIADGFYFMAPFNRATMISKILKKL